MVTETVKSTQITNFDASPAVATTKGEGAPYKETFHDVNVATTSGVTTGSKYLLHRVKSNAIVKSLVISCEAMGGASAADIGLSYADDARYIAPGQVAAAVIDADFFKAAQSLVSALELTNVYNGNVLTVASSAKRSQPLWQAAGLTSDPGGYFDIVATTTATITTGGQLYAKLGLVAA